MIKVPKLKPKLLDQFGQVTRLENLSKQLKLVFTARFARSAESAEKGKEQTPRTQRL